MAEDENIHNGERIYHDAWGEEYVVVEGGARRPPSQTSKKTKSSGFTSYDTSKGHCGLCGSLYCRGNCFK